MLRRIITALVLVPLAIIIIAFAVANRQIVTVSFDPFGSTPPAASLTLPLFALIIALVIVGVVIGGAAAWVRQSRWRRTARRFEREASDLRAKLDALQGNAGAPSLVSRQDNRPQRLKLSPPAR